MPSAWISARSFMQAARCQNQSTMQARCQNRRFQAARCQKWSFMQAARCQKHGALAVVARQHVNVPVKGHSLNKKIQCSRGPKIRDNQQAVQLAWDKSLALCHNKMCCVIVRVRVRAWADGWPGRFGAVGRNLQAAATAQRGSELAGDHQQWKQAKL